MKEKKSCLPDIQKTSVKGGNINRVGVSGIDFPLLVKQKYTGKNVLCYASVDIYVSLKTKAKGINMSRLPRKLMEYRNKSFDDITLRNFLMEVKNFSECNDAYARFSFKYFMDKVAPISKEKSVMAYDIAFIGKVNSKNKFFSYLEVAIMGESSCPCSKALAEGKGSHTQNSKIVATVETQKGKFVYIEDLVVLLESCTSCEIYPILKRPDEKYVTIKAYENSKFVEDEVREAAIKLQKTKLLKWYKVKVVNYESIHKHTADAVICRKFFNGKWISSVKEMKS